MDLKLNILELINFYINSSNLVISTISLLNELVNNNDVHLVFTFFYIQPYNYTCNFAWKFLIAISYLILIRGGTPRYRYDYLTKLGWLKFIGLVVLSFFFILLTFIII